jgi:nucleoid-associated protein YgaU
MPKQMIKGFLLILSAVFVAGCAAGNASSGGITTRAYFADKDREDQNRQGGNQGYIMGTPKADNQEYKKTRKIYVVEVTKEVPEDQGGSLVPPPRPKPAPRVSQPTPPVAEPAWTKPVSLPPIESVTVEKKSEPEACQEYTVQKGDTLQKISKKFYGSYKKWNKIYEANKDKMKSPDALKVGMKLCVPGGAVEAAPEADNLK